MIKEYQKTQRKCPICNYMFYPVRPKQTPCSNQPCAVAFRKLTARKKYVEKTGAALEGRKVKCRVCQKEFKTNRKDVVLCSYECRDTNGRDIRRVYNRNLRAANIS